MVLNEERCRSQWKQWLAAFAMMLLMVMSGSLEILVEINIHTLIQYVDVPRQLEDLAILLTLIGCIIGAIFGAISADTYGRRRTLYATTICGIVEIINFIFAGPSIHCINLIFGGINAGIVFTVVPLYISEIADDQIRGGLLMLQLVGVFIGQLMVMSIGTIMINIGTLIIPMLLFTALRWFPETPYHLISKKQYEAAEKSLSFFRGIDQITAKEELEVIINSEEENCSPQRLSQRICELFRGKNRKGLLIVVLLIIMQWDKMFFNIRFDLAYALQNINTMTVTSAMIIICVTRLIWSSILVLTIDIVGRRLYLLGSTLAGLAIVSFASVVIMDRSYISFSTNFILYLCQIIIFGIPLVFVGELFTTHVKSIASATVVIFATIFKFGILAIDQWIVPELRDYEFFIFILIYLFAFVFILALIPETKKKSLPEIQHALADTRLQCRYKDVAE